MAVQAAVDRGDQIAAPGLPFWSAREWPARDRPRARPEGHAPPGRDSDGRRDQEPAKQRASDDDASSLHCSRLRVTLDTMSSAERKPKRKVDTMSSARRSGE